MLTTKDKLFIDCFNEFYMSQKLCRYVSGKDLTNSILEGYNDLNFRTMKGHKNSNKAKNLIEIEKKIIPSKGVDDIIKEVSRIFDADSTFIDKSQSFGKAQKVVNMSFKYLYYFEKKKGSRSGFSYCNCDIPIDAYILKFYLDYEKKYGLKTINGTVSWSKITEKEYNLIQKNLRDYIIKVGLSMLPLEAESIIWNYGMIASSSSKKPTKNQKDCYSYIKKYL